MTKLSARRALAAGSTVCALTLVSPSTFGQTAPSQATASPSSTGLEEVIVTVRYREESLQRTPVAVTAITGEDIEQRGFTNSSDIAYTVSLDAGTAR